MVKICFSRRVRSIRWRWISAGAVIMTVFIAACNYRTNKEPDHLKEGAMNTASFGFDRSFLRQNDTALVQLTSGESSILVSPKFQGKVFTSSAAGDEGRSFGWINYKAFSEAPDPHMNAYGGENRLWIGPEGGPFSVFFSPGDTMIFDNWKTPTAFDSETWQKARQDDTSVAMRKEMRLLAYNGSVFDLNVQRTVTIQAKNAIEKTLNIELTDSVKFVGYSTINSIRNIGKIAWTDSTGMPCIWILDMFNPGASTTVVIPFRRPAQSDERIATTNYFGEPGDSRLRITDSVIFFKADGRKRSKIGVLPPYALPVAGSYDASNRLLTVIYFSVQNDGRYLNQVWSTNNPVFSGDAMNAYNDGPLDDGSQMGPFYELESVSPAAALKPGESLVHRHDVYHFTGTPKYLDSIAIKLLGANIRTISRAFRN
jgi:hypothetical protein